MNKKKWIEIARTGTFTDSVGREQTFTEADLDAIALAYKPEIRDAPLVFGHPKSDAAPAFGWIEKLKHQGEKLFALFAHVPDEVKDLVAKRHYRHVSMSLMPDRVTLRHVALLGAAQPAIDGLQAVDLTGGDDAICVEFTQEISAARDGGGPRGGSEAATAFAASDSESHTGRVGERHCTTKGDKPMTPEELQRQIGQLQAQLEALKTENATLKKKLDDTSDDKDEAESAKTDAEKQADAVTAEFSAYKSKVESEKREGRVAALVKAGKVKPAEKDSVLSFAAKLADTPGTVDFSAPDGKQEAISVEERYFRDLEARPVDERFTVDFSAPPVHGGHGGHAGNLPSTYDPAQMAAKM